MPRIAFRPTAADADNLAAVLAHLRQSDILAGATDALRFALERASAALRPAPAIGG